MKKIALMVVCTLLLSSVMACSKRENVGKLGTIDSSILSSDNSENEPEESKHFILDEDGVPVTGADGEAMAMPDVIIEETMREPSEILPDVAVYDKTVLENYTLVINSSERYTINYPNSFIETPVDKYKTYLVKGNTQIFLYCINDSFESPNSVYYSNEVRDVLYRFPYKIDGKDYTASVVDRGRVTQEIIRGKKVVKEVPTMEFASDDIKSFIKPVCVSYFTDFDNRGFALIATSTDKNEEELGNILADMISTLGTYTPASSEAQYEFENMFVAEDKTGISFPYPDGWSIIYKNGYYIISPPADGALYDGAKIIYKSDEQHKVVDDYAQFVGITDGIAPFYMKPGYDKERLETDFSVLSMDDTMSLNGVKCILFEVEDYLRPLNRATELLLPSTGEIIHSYRYTFNSNGIPVMVGFFFTDYNRYQVRDMADNIMSKITIK